MRYLLLGIFAAVALHSVSQEDLAPPYNTAEILPFLDHGWYNVGPQLEAQIKNNNVKTIIEIGSWLGASTRHLASCLPEDGIIYAVDHWKGSAEHQPGQPYWIPELEKLYDYFLSNTIHAHLTHKIIPVKMDSLEAAAQLNVQANLIFIDASHDTESVYKTMIAWYPHLIKNGVLCGTNWVHSSSLQDAVHRFVREFGLHVKKDGNFWYVQRYKH